MDNNMWWILKPRTKREGWLSEFWDLTKTKTIDGRLMHAYSSIWGVGGGLDKSRVDIDGKEKLFEPRLAGHHERQLVALVGQTRVVPRNALITSNQH